jgi:hypothetical protein
MAFTPRPDDEPCQPGAWRYGKFSRMKFSDTTTDQQARFSIGREIESGRFFLSIPVSNGFADYEEYYEISRAMHDSYPGNREALIAFAEACRRHERDALLLQKPGRNRGVG